MNKKSLCIDVETFVNIDQQGLCVIVWKGGLNK